MARLPSDKFLIQQIGDNVVLFEDGTEREIVRYNIHNGREMATAQFKIADSRDLNDEDKAFANFWCGYFFAHSTL
jgi:hypothetical protein